MGTIADKISVLNQTKADIKEAIIAKGGEVLDTDPFSMYAERLNEAKSGGDKVLAQISAPLASPLVEGEKVWIEKNTGAAGAIYKHSGGVIGAGTSNSYNTIIYKIGDVFTNSYTNSSYRDFYLAKYDKESQKFYHGGVYSGYYFFLSLNNKQRLKGLLFKYGSLNYSCHYYNGSTFQTFTAACNNIFTGTTSSYFAASTSSSYAFCGDYSATDSTTQKNWCIVKLGLENGVFSQEVTASGYTDAMRLYSIKSLFGTEDYCFVRDGGYTHPEQGSTVLKVDFINGTVEPYTFVGLGGTGSVILRYIYEDQFIVTSGGVKYKIVIDDSAKTITFTDGVVVENPPGTVIEQANDCENIFYGNNTYYWVDNPADFDTISFKKIYTVTQGAAGSYQSPVFATDNKLFCAGVLLSENGGVVDTDAITEPLTAIYYISDGGYVTAYQKVLKLGVGAFSYSTGGTKVSSITSPFFPLYWCFNGSLFYDRPGGYPCRVYIRDNLGFIRKEHIGVWWDSSNSYATGIVRGNLFGSMWTESGSIVQPTIKEVQEDGSIIEFTVTRSPWSPTNTRYDANIYWEGNDIYARVGNSGALKGTIDWENKTIDWGESMYLTNRTTVQTLQTLYRTYDDLYDIGKGGVYEYNKETCQYVLKTPWPDEIITALGGSPSIVQVLNDKHINLARYGKSVLIKYDDTGIENAEIMTTLNLEDYIGPFSTQYSDGTGWLYSFNREYVTLVTVSGDITDNGATNICFKLGDSSYEYNAFKPSYTNLNSNWLTGKFTGNQGTDENGRRYVEVSTVLPEEESS